MTVYIVMAFVGLVLIGLCLAAVCAVYDARKLVVPRWLLSTTFCCFAMPMPLAVVGVALLAFE